MRRLDGIIDSIDMNLSKLQDIVKDREAWCAVVLGVSKSRTWLLNNNNNTTEKKNPLAAVWRMDWGARIGGGWTSDRSSDGEAGG